jgi:uncharacterized protein (TIGR03118 family)
MPNWLHSLTKGWNRRPRPRHGARGLALECLEERCLLTAGYLQTNLVSDLPGMARLTDPNLVNPWGIVTNPNGALWISDNGSGMSTIDDGTGQPFPPQVITIPPPAGGMGPSSPTGVVFNNTGAFTVQSATGSGASFFIFDTEDGTISAWAPSVNPTQAILEVDNSASGAGAVYKGLAIDSTAAGNFLLATNFRSGNIDVFDQNFHPTHLAGSFSDPGIPAGFAPFNIAVINGTVFVTYALQNAQKNADVAGPGNGFIDVFDTNGNFLRRFASQGPLNSPWGMTLAPADFGPFSNDLLVGNFGDGHINVFNPSTGAFLGQMTDTSGNPIAIDRLWGLTFGGGGPSNGAVNTLFFTAGIQDEQHGLFGTLQAHASESVGAFDPTTATFFLRNENSSGAPDGGSFQFGAPGWKAVMGDWTGTGQQTVAVVDPTTETWYIRTSNSSGAPSFTPFQFGAPGWIPVAGDWMGTGHDGIGVVDPTTGTWYLRNEISGGAPDAGQFVYGAPGWMPVTGDWNGSGHTGIGMVNPGTETWYLRNSASSGAPDVAPFTYGGPGWTPVAGDWSGSGHTGIGVFNPTGTWFLRNSPDSGAADFTPFAFGVGSWTPLAGSFGAAATSSGGGIYGSMGTPAAPAITPQDTALMQMANAGVMSDLMGPGSNQNQQPGSSQNQQPGSSQNQQPGYGMIW